MFWIGWSSYAGLRNVPDNALTIEAVAMMYSWIFIYPNEKEAEDELVPEDPLAASEPDAAEMCVTSMAMPASPLAASALPALNPNHPTHSIDAPVTAIVML